MVDCRKFVAMPDASEIDSEVRKIVISWEKNASNQQMPFERFIFRWLSFNGWLACVTGKEFDKEILEDFTVDRFAGDCFQKLIRAETDFSAAVGKCSSFPGPADLRTASSIVSLEEP